MVERIKDTCIRIRSEMNGWPAFSLRAKKMLREQRKFCRKHGIVIGKTAMAGAVEIIWKTR